MRLANIEKSAQEARFNQNRQQFSKILLVGSEQNCQNNPTLLVEHSSNFAQKQLPVFRLCKTNDSLMVALRQMGPSMTDRPVTTMRKLSESQDAMDESLNEMSKKTKREAVH